MTRQGEKAAGLAFLPPLVTIGFYLLSSHWQSQLIVQCVPQLIAYLALGCWAFHNVDHLSQLGLEANKIRVGLGWGTITGITLGCINSMVILYLVPALGENIEFLRNTPHANVPFGIMVPWFIFIIAIAVELNFRGFLLGRLLIVFSAIRAKLGMISPFGAILGTAFPLGISALTFSFDPFMVSTFRHLHWIALWDGLIWGWMWIRFTNLYAVITAHAIEVIIVYLVVREALT